MYRRPDDKPTSFFRMLTVSDKMREFFELVRRVARTDAPALIRGQTGTGKELVAGAIHRLSQRFGGPFQVLNCATLTRDLLESQLFGHKKGAFTGAIEAREGLFSRADQGTIFLDEIAEVPLDLQAKLLRVLEERTFTPVGATESLRIDVRLVSATHVSLRQAAKNNRPPNCSASAARPCGANFANTASRRVRGYKHAKDRCELLLGLALACSHSSSARFFVSFFACVTRFLISCSAHLLSWSSILRLTVWTSLPLIVRSFKMSLPRKTRIYEPSH